MTETAAGTPKAKRERQFGRVYDHAAGTAVLSSAFAKGYKLDVALAAIPQNVIQGFALQSLCDYVVNEANDALKDGPEKKEGETPATEEEKRMYALKVLEEALGELVSGNVDFRSGTGLGGARSAIGAVGQALFELGKKFVMQPDGTKLEFSDVNSARDAVKRLYTNTTAFGPNKISGRMIFNAIQNDEKVKAKVDELRKAKPKTKVQDVSAFMGGDEVAVDPAGQG